MELPEESLAHHHSRASYNYVPIGHALHNIPEQHLLPDIRKQSFPDTSSYSQRCLRNLISINRHLPLPWNEKNPDFLRTPSSDKEQDSSADATEASSTSLDLTAYPPNHSGQTKTDSPPSGPCSDAEASLERARGSYLKSWD